MIPPVRGCSSAPERLLQWGQSLTARPARGARRAPRPRPARPGRRRPRRTPRGRTTRRRAAPTRPAGPATDPGRPAGRSPSSAGHPRPARDRPRTTPTARPASGRPAWTSSRRPPLQHASYRTSVRTTTDPTAMPWRRSTTSTAPSASADRRWPGRRWPGSRPGNWRRPTSGGSCERGRGLPVGAGPGDRHGVLLHRATPLRAGRPRGGRSVGLGPPGSVAGLLGEGRRRPPGGAPQQRLPPRHRRVDHPPGPTRWPPGAATSSPPAASAALWLSRSESRYPQRCASGAGAPAPRPRPQSGSASTTRTAPVAWSSAVCRHRRMHLNQRTSPPHRGGGGRDRGSG
jgi:hypothetical protein